MSCQTFLNNYFYSYRLPNEILLRCRGNIRKDLKRTETVLIKGINMNEERLHFFYTKVSRVYENIGKDLASNKIELGKFANMLAHDISKENIGFQKDLELAFQFVIQKFSGKMRGDGRTPLAWHSIYLAQMLNFFGERDPDSYFTAVCHDLLEDTDTTWEEINGLKFRYQTKPVSVYVPFLKEDESLSYDFTQGFPPRVSQFIIQLRGAPSPVINTELVDRVNDLSDLGYLDSWEHGKKRNKIIEKVWKAKNIAHHITEGRNDINVLALEVLKYRMNMLESEMNMPVSIVDIL